MQKILHKSERLIKTASLDKPLYLKSLIKGIYNMKNIQLIILKFQKWFFGLDEPVSPKICYDGFSDCHLLRQAVLRFELKKRGAK